ncbi:MAG TPA: hypothetical protein DIW61_11680 [Candidatus Aminicenantes bacterium]|nr:hypothetical protein [Candidatus Aminicenantes bacterium]
MYSPALSGLSFALLGPLRSLSIASGREVFVRRRRLAHTDHLPGAGIRVLPEQPALDRLFKAQF